MATNAYVPPTSTIGPVGCGMPPAGSSVIANIFGAMPSGTFYIQCAVSLVAGLKTPALIGFPSIGTTQS